MSGSGTLRVTRPAGPHRDSRRTYRLLVDGEERARLAPGEQVDLRLPAGPHRVRAAIDWTGSPEVAVQVRRGRRTALRAEPSGPAVAALFQLFGRTRYLRLVPDVAGDAGAGGQGPQPAPGSRETV
jgi:hypothetical protein